MQTAVFSIISPNYRHFARVLMDSVRRHHPEWDRFLLLVGQRDPVAEESFTSVQLEELPLPNRQQFCFRYSILELNTAVKPWMFEHLFARGYDRVVYFDPDIRIFSPLAELDALPPETFLALTPHLTGFIGGGDLHPSERTILQAGAYNLGFLSAARRPALGDFLRWWKEKLEYRCVVDIPHGLFVDQKWLDLAPGLFPDVEVLRHEGYNVAYWNLRQRTVAGQSVNGQPLRFFHFSGFDPAVPEVVSRHDPQLAMADVGDARALFDGYADAVRAAEYERFRKSPYAYGTFHDGTPVTYAARVAYRNSDELQNEAGEDPFAHPELFRRFDTPLMAKTALRMYKIVSRARPLMRLVPRPIRAAARDYLLKSQQPAPVPARPQPTLPPGLNVAGYVHRDTGVGESARLCRNACEAAGLPSRVIDVDTANEGTRPQYRATIFHVNADQVGVIRDRAPGLFAASAYNIGVWHWELPELPDMWLSSAEPLDEIWAPTAFVQSAVSRKVTIPVVHMPHGVKVTEIEACSPMDLGAPAGRFTFLCMFDLDSVMERKNPYGAIEAFRRAFGNDDRAALLIKAGRADRHPEQFAALEEAVRGMTNVYLTDRMLSRARTNGLIAACDAVVSLHRSEGFGLVLAEAMYLGKPVVATGWSGNMDFMNSGNSCPVGYELVTLARDHFHYRAGQQWAEPDVEHAAQLMRRLVDDEAWRAQLGERASNTMLTQFSPEAAGLRYLRRLAFLGLMAEWP